MSLRIASAMPVSAKMLVLAVLCAVTSDSLAQQLNSPIRSEGRPELAAEVCLPQAPDFRERCVPGEILMKFKSSVAREVKSAILAELHLKPLHLFEPENILHAKLDEDADVMASVRRLSGFSEVLFAEPNFYLAARFDQTIPNDQLYPTNLGRQWHFDNQGQTVNDVAGIVDADIDMPEGWDIHTGTEDVIVAVFDTGANISHPDFVSTAVDADGIPKDNWAWNRDEYIGWLANGKADDGQDQGYVERSGTFYDDVGSLAVKAYP